ncbi:MAG TPA: hypothetical protein VME45_13700 [Stellaceae bacterium]|nr:hypothetical protein [Stellaceae bacterium]
MGLLCVALCTEADAVTLDELKGYSIEAHATANNVWKHSQGRDDPMSNDIHVVRKIYVSLSGRVFDYADVTAGMASEHERAVLAPNAAASGPRQQMVAWTIEDGNLIGISRQVEGFIIRTVTIDLARMTCSFTAVARPDPATGRVVMMKLNGYQDELVSTTVRSADCTIRRGNIFSTDQ